MCIRDRATGYYAKVFVYNVTNNFSLLHTLKYHEQPVFELQISVQDGQIISGGWDDSLVIWDLATGAIQKVFQNIPAFKLLSFENDEIIIVHTEGVIEKIGKSLSCEVDDSAMKFVNCQCDEIEGKLMYFNQSSGGMPTCDVITQVTIKFQAYSPPQIFSLEFSEKWWELILSLIHI
eukprot:TRINITY_DN6815_c0_g1_i2.p2 TRINITY_DN6815_c0_g1~~TRINITY_DN6815_c0_g1_i2.p2  ORF type:complete len:177 (-),score=22.58 TRINITY_DN6815_c0_g1_i2:140-670(-)